MYSLEAPRRGASNEYPRHMFLQCMKNWRKLSHVYEMTEDPPSAPSPLKYAYFKKITKQENNMGRNVNKRTFWHVCPTKTQIRAHPRSLTSLRCPHGKQLHPRLSKMRPAKIPIRLRIRAVWSESSLSAHVRRYAFWRFGSYGFKRSSAICTIRCCFVMRSTKNLIRLRRLIWVFVERICQKIRYLTLRLKYENCRSTSYNYGLFCFTVLILSIWTAIFEQSVYAQIRLRKPQLKEH